MSSEAANQALSFSRGKIAIKRLRHYRWMQEIVPFVAWLYVACYVYVPLTHYFATKPRITPSNVRLVYVVFLGAVFAYLCFAYIRRRSEARTIRQLYSRGTWVSNGSRDHGSFLHAQKVHSLRVTHVLILIAMLLCPLFQSSFDEMVQCFFANLIACGVYGLTQRMLYGRIHRWFVYFFEPGRDYFAGSRKIGVHLNESSSYPVRLGFLQGSFGVLGTLVEVHNGPLDTDRRYNSVWGHRYIVIVDLHKDMAFSLDYRPNFYEFESDYIYRKKGQRMSGAFGERNFEREGQSRALITRTLLQVLGANAAPMKRQDDLQGDAREEEQAGERLDVQKDVQSEARSKAQFGTQNSVVESMSAVMSDSMVTKVSFADASLAAPPHPTTFDRVYDAIHTVALAIYALIPPSLLVWHMVTTHSVPRSAQDWQTVGVLTVIYVGYLGLIVLCRLFHVYATVGLSLILTVIVTAVVGQVVSPYLAVVALYAVLWTIFWGRYHWNLIRYKIGLRVDAYKYNR